MTVLQLKAYAERRFGIPVEQLRFSYLEELDMIDHRRLFDYSMSPGSLISITLWPQYERLYRAVASNSLPALQSLLASPDPRFPANDPCVWAALFQAAFCGHTGAPSRSSFVFCSHDSQSFAGILSSVVFGPTWAAAEGLTNKDHCLR